MSYSPNHVSSRTASDTVQRPVKGGVWRFDLDYTSFSAGSGTRRTVDLRPDAWSSSIDVIVHRVYARVGTAWAGEAVVQLNLGSSGGDANDFFSEADLTVGSALIGTSAAEIGTKSPGALLDGTLVATVDVGAGDVANLTAGTVSVFVDYSEVVPADHVETQYATPAGVADPGNATPGGSSSSSNAPAPGEILLHDTSAGTASAYATIALALAAAASGDVVVVGAGSYTEAVTIPSGVTLQGYPSRDQVILGGGVGTQVTLSAGSVLRDVRLDCPLTFQPAVVFNGAAGEEARVSSVVFRGGSSSSIGAHNTGAGSLIMEKACVESGAFDAAFKCSAGVFRLSDSFAMDAQATSVFEVAGGTLDVHQFDLLEGGTFSIADGVRISGGTLVGSGLNFRGKTGNGMHVIADGVGIYVRDSDFRGTTYDWNVDPILTGAGTVIRVSFCEYRLDLSTYPANYASNIELLSLFEADGPNDDPAFFIVGDVTMGLPAAPSEVNMGEGDSTTLGMRVFTATGANSDTTTGTLTDETAAAQSSAGSAFDVFKTGALHDATYFLSEDPRTFSGMRVDLDTALVLGTGEISWEYWNGSTWEPLITSGGVEYPRGVCVTQKAWPYTPRGDAAFEVLESQHIQFDPPSDWTTTTIGGATGYAVRVRVGDLAYTGTAVTTSARIQRVKLHTNRLQVNADGRTERFGRAQPRRTFWEGTPASLSAPSGGANAPSSVNISFSANIDYQQSAGWQKGERAGDMISIPEGLNTSRPVTLTLAWKLPTGAGLGNVIWDFVAASVREGAVLGSLTEQTITQDVTPSALETVVVTSFDFYVSELVGGQDFLAWMLYRALSSSGTSTGTAVPLALSLSGYFWRS